MLLEAALLFQVVSRPMIVAPAEYRTRVMAEVLRLWDPGTGRPMRLAAWSVAVDGFWRHNDSLPMEVSHRFSPRGKPRDETTRREVASAARRHITGTALAPYDGESAEWSLRVKVDRPSHGTEVKGSLEQFTQAPLALSDIVVGDTAQALVVTIGKHEVVLAPRQAIARESPVSIYFQVRSPVAADTARFTYRLRRIVGGASVADEELRVSMVGVVAQGITAVEQALGVSQLTGDHYELEIRVEVDATRIATGATSLHLIQGVGER
jgi:hypothetical protein